MARLGRSRPFKPRLSKLLPLGATIHAYAPDGGSTATGGSATVGKSFFVYTPDGGATATSGTAVIGKSFVYIPNGGSTATGGSAGLGHGALHVYIPNGGSTTTGGTGWVIVSANRAAVATAYGTFTVATDATQLRNDVTVTGGTAPVTVTDTFTADGLTIYWPLSYPPDTSSDVATPSLTVGGVTKTVSSAGSGSISSQYGLQTLGDQYVALLTGTDGVPASGTVLVLTYTYQAPVLPRLINSTSIAAGAALPNAGYFSAQPPTSPAATLGAAVQAAQSQLTLYANPFTTVNVLLPQNYSGTGLDEDQQIQFVSNRLGINAQMAIVKIAWVGGQGGSADSSKCN